MMNTRAVLGGVQFTVLAPLNPKRCNIQDIERDIIQYVLITFEFDPLEYGIPQLY